MESAQSLSVIIPTMDGEALLRANLPALLAELERYDGASEVIVTEDGGTDGTAALLRGFGSRVRLCRNPREAGFARNADNGAGHAAHELLFFLNNDVRVTPGALTRLVRHFQAPDVFGVSPTSLILKGRAPLDEMPTRGYWKDGLILVSQPYRPPTTPPDGVQETFHICGGFSMVRRKMFEELGGFDDLSLPSTGRTPTFHSGRGVAAGASSTT